MRIFWAFVLPTVAAFAPSDRGSGPHPPATGSDPRVEYSRSAEEWIEDPNMGGA